MSHGGPSVSLKDVPLIVTAQPFRLSIVAKVVLLVGIVVGLLTFVDGLTGKPAEVQHTWAAFLVNFIYWFYVSAALACFAAVLKICDAEWARPIWRLFEAGNRFFFFAVVPLLVLYFGHHHLYEWAQPGASEHVRRGIWLTSKFVFVRDALAVFILALLARKVMNLSLARDIGAIRRGLTGVEPERLERWSHKSYDRYLIGWGDDTRGAIRQATDQMGFLSPIVVIAYAVLTSLIAFDLVMSIDPHWYSTLFGAFLFMSAVYGAMAWASIGVAFGRELHPIFRVKIERRTLHDLSKLLFGFGIFWAYLFWAHYLTIWYGNMPEETHWVILRLREEPWHSWAWTVFGCCFIVPFFLGLSRDVKQVPRLLFGTSLFVTIGLWTQTYLLITPSLYPHAIPFNVIDLFVSIGFLSAFLLSTASYLEQVPLVPFGDLYQK